MNKMKITGLSLYAMTDLEKGGVINLDKEDEENILGLLLAKYNKIEINEVKGLRKINLSELEE